MPTVQRERRWRAGLPVVMGDRGTWLHLAGLSSVAVAQPLLGPLAANPEFFIAHRAGAADILTVVAALIVLPTALLMAFVLAAGLIGPVARSAVLGLIVAALTGVVGMQAAVQGGVTAWSVAVPLSAIAGLGVGIAYVRVAPVRSFFTMLSLAVVVVPAAFLLSPGIRALVIDPIRRASVLTPVLTGRAAANTPVVLVVFDELPLISLLDRNRQIDRALYPNFSALARDGIWFRNATAVSDFTRWAVPAILTGRYPRHSALPALGDHPNNLFTLVGNTHRLEVHETLTSLCPPQLCTADAGTSIAERMGTIASDLWIVFRHASLTSDLTASLPKTTTTWARFADNQRAQGGDGESEGDAASVSRSTRVESERVRVVRQFIEGIDREDPQPSLYFLHTLISHHPYGRLPGNRANRTTIEPPGKGDRGWDPDQQWAISQHYQKQLLQTGYVDDLLGQLVRRLKEMDLYERALVVVTSDHGVSFVPRTSQRSFSTRSAADIMRIPLIVKVPRGTSVLRPISDQNAESIDILPTIADALDLDVPWPIDGSSLLAADRRDRPGKAMQSGASGRRWRFRASGPDLKAALRRKLALFGDGAANVDRVPRLPPFDQLVGRPVNELPVADGGGRVELTHSWAFANVDPAADSMSFDVAGQFASPRPDTAVGVAVNGVLEAVTRTWEANPRGWLATPRAAIWRPGRNTVDVFVIEQDRGRFLLRRTTFDDVRPADLNLISDAARDWGVIQSNFYPRAGDAEKHFRWTRDWAQLSNLVTHTRPREVEIEVAMIPGAPKVLKVQANACTLFEGPISGRWSGTFPLRDCATGASDLILRFTTDAPRGAVDRRRLGVAVSRVVVR